ncbi:esterase [Yaniella halotolerans]|uniref:esterase n=1 Tax=Yaniella halotolerans TaxID=225453 RepID=UPI0003B595B4|nr:esterase [Yaniella halotolerans]
MYPETLSTGHRVMWSLPEALRTEHLVLVFHDAGSTMETVAEHYFGYLPETATGLAIQAGFDATFGNSWFTTTDHEHANFPEVISAAHRVFDTIDEDEYGTTSYTSIQLLGVGQGAALATTLLRVRPEVVNSLVGIDGYVIDNAMLAALDNGGAETSSQAAPVLWLTIEDSNDPSAEFAHDWLTANTRLIEAESTSAITPFLTQNVS